MRCSSVFCVAVSQEFCDETNIGVLACDNIGDGVDAHDEVMFVGVIKDKDSNLPPPIISSRARFNSKLSLDDELSLESLTLSSPALSEP